MDRDKEPSRVQVACIALLEAIAESERLEGGDRELALVKTKAQEALMWNSTRDGLREQAGIA